MSSVTVVLEPSLALESQAAKLKALEQEHGRQDEIEDQEHHGRLRDPLGIPRGRAGSKIWGLT